MRAAMKAARLPATGPGPAGVPGRGGAWIAAVSGLAVACYLNALGGDFVLDDVTLVVRNATLRDVRHLPDLLLSGMTSFLGPGGSSYYRPVPMVLLMGLYSGFGPEPVAFHVASVALHAASAALVFLLARRLVPAAAPWAAALGAAVFAVHPASAEAVAWISGIQDAAAGFLALLALYAWIRSDTAAGAARWRAVALAALLLALLSKESALAVVVVIAVWDVTARRERVDAIPRALRTWAPLAAVVVAYLALRALALGGLAPARHAAPPPLLAVPILLARYLELLVAPVRLTVAHDVPLDGLGSAAGALRAALPLAALAALAALAWRARARHATWLALLVVPLAPPLAALAASRPVGLANRLAERHLYLATAGLAVAVTALLAWAAARSPAARRGAAAAAVAVVVALGGLTVARNRVWRDELALWTDAIETCPAVADCHFNLAAALRRAGDHPRSAAEFQAAFRLDPMMILDRFAVGARTLEAGDPRAAIPDLLVTTLAAPHLVEPRYLLAVALDRAGRGGEAVAHYREVLRLAPGHAGARRALAGR